MLMPIFYERPNNRKIPTLSEMERKRNKNGKSKLARPMDQHGRNDSYQSHRKNKR